MSTDLAVRDGATLFAGATLPEPSSRPRPKPRPNCTPVIEQRNLYQRIGGREHVPPLVEGWQNMRGDHRRVRRQRRQRRSDPLAAHPE